MMLDMRSDVHVPFYESGRTRVRSSRAANFLPGFYIFRIRWRSVNTLFSVPKRGTDEFKFRMKTYNGAPHKVCKLQENPC